jgi:hypothetical protein
MGLFSVSNQLLQIDTGVVRTYLYNPTLGFAPWKGLGENQVLGQRYIASVNATSGVNTAVLNPSGAPAIFMLVQYKSTGKPAPVAGPAPVYWTDETYTTVSGVESEALLGLNGAAGYLMLNTTDYSGLTDALLEGAYCLIQVGGYLQNAWAPTSGTPGVGNLITPLAGNWASQNVVASATAGGVACRSFGVQATVITTTPIAGLCDVLVNCDII